MEMSFNLGHPANRLVSFKRHKWIHKEDAPCSPLEMAKAGFVATRKDCAVCHYCKKELDYWEAVDVPWNEHKAHNPECPFVKYYATPPDQVLVIDALRLEKDRLIYQAELEHKKNAAEIEKQREAIRAAMEARGKHGKSKKKA
uniref:Baculoviral IAP repeat-containing protein 5 n=2 Tax=Lygus hesperus TaxID=30085 RepID=A0A0A9XES8_LYGHE